MSRRMQDEWPDQLLQPPALLFIPETAPRTAGPTASLCRPLPAALQQQPRRTALPPTAHRRACRLPVPITLNHEPPEFFGEPSLPPGTPKIDKEAAASPAPPAPAASVLLGCLFYLHRINWPKFYISGD